MKRNRVNMKEIMRTLAVTVGAGALAGISIAMNKRADRIEMVNELNEGIFEYMEKKQREEELTNDQYNEIIDKMVENRKQLLKIGYERFIDKEIKRFKFKIA